MSPATTRVAANPPSASMLSLLLSLTLALPLHATPQDAAPAVAHPTHAEVDTAIDKALHWVRTQQDLETGSYGSVLLTIGALDALTSSPRRYRPSDGPYVAKALDFVVARQNNDGSFGQGEHTVALTCRMADVLGRFDGYAPTTERVAAFLNGRMTGAGSQKTLANAREMLAARNADGAWGEGPGALLATIDEVVELNELSALLRVRAKAAGPGAPKTATALPTFDASDRARAAKGLVRGAAFLLDEQVEPGKWGFSGQADPGITAMVVGGLLATPEPRAGDVNAAVSHALDWLISLQHEDGSIHAGQLANYVTSASVMALVKAGREGDREVVARARGFLQALQSDEGEGYSESDRFYGGVGYGGDERPDLSNMQMALEALHDAGVETGDATFTKALAFLERCQNRSESNTLEIVEGGSTTVSGNDGGAGYAPGDSKAGFVELRDGRRVPRSYGSMTYALLKGYLFAGLSKDDARVQAAWDWLSKNYTLDVNPGFEASADPTAAYQGLFYYFTTMAKALDLYGDERVVDANGVEHDWRAELSGRLLAMQRQDGSWINSNAPRWFEGNPVLATAYALVSIGTALPE